MSKKQKKSKKSKKLKLPNPTIAYGFTGVWRNNTLGWMGLSHIGGDRTYPDRPCLYGDRINIMQNERVYLCKVVLTPVVDKLGRPITKIIKNKEA